MKTVCRAIQVGSELPEWKQNVVREWISHSRIPNDLRSTAESALQSGVAFTLLRSRGRRSGPRWELRYSLYGTASHRSV